MGPKRVGFRLAAISAVATFGGCGVPHFDVPTYSGDPTVQTIVYRIECEFRDMVRDDRPDDPTTFHNRFLLDNDYDIEVSLSLEVNDTGGLAPMLSYMTTLSPLTSVVANLNGTLSESRDHNFTENLQFSIRKIYADWKTGANPHDCPTPDTNLSGTLGLKDFVTMADLTPNLDQKQTLSGKGVFGGSIQFLVTKQINAIGPTWTLVHFKGPGPLGSLSEVNTDKLTVAFAQGPNVGKPMAPFLTMRHPNGANPYAHFFLQQLLTQSISTQLSIIQNTLH
jgi:hypothetical protein